MEVKDLVTMIIASSGLITSVTVAVYNVRNERRKTVEAAQKRFSEAIIGLTSVRAKFATLKAELGASYNDAASRERRVSLSDERSFYISQAKALVEIGGVSGSPFEHLLLAASLMDRGRIVDAVEQYRIATLSNDEPYGKAEALRVYGRAVYEHGDLRNGRSIMMDAARQFIELSNSPDYEHRIMLAETCDTYRRLAECELKRGQFGYADSALTHVENLSPGLYLDASNYQRNLAQDLRSRLELAQREHAEISNEAP